MKRILGMTILIAGLALGTGLPTGCGNGDGDGPFSGLWDLIENLCSGDYTFADTLDLSLTGTTEEGGVEFQIYDAEADGFDTVKVLIVPETGELLFCLDPAGTIDFAVCDTLCFGLVTDGVADFFCEVGATDICGPVSYDQR